MKKLIFILALWCAAGGIATTYGQELSPAQYKALNAIAKPGSTPSWMRIKEGLKFTPAAFFTKNRVALGLGETDEFKLIRTETDQLGMTHYRYQRVRDGVPVYGGEYILHEDAGRVYAANGILINPAAWKSGSTLPETKALQQALNLSASKKFLWKDRYAEYMLKERERNPDATFFPTGELCWLDPAGSGQFYVKAWRFDINTSDGLSERIFLDASNGKLLKKIPLDLNCNAGSGTTTWNGTVSISTDQSGSNFILLDDCQSPNLHVFNSNDSTSLAFATEYTDADNNWTGQTSAVQTFFGINQAWQYYVNRHGRNSYDNGGANINAYNEAGFTNSSGNTYWSNASWSQGSQVLRFGDNGNAGAGDDWNATDIVGHEFTHAVTQFSAGLDYNGESGALNESFSDIFGEMVELFSEGAVDWLVGADRGAIRDMTNPNNFNDPDTYLGTNWVAVGGTCDGTNDFCGVHTNSGVQNFWFYLLAVGGTGVNDNGDTYTVQGIGTTSAARIAYRSLTQYLTNSSGYADAKNGAIQAAIDLFGDCSNEVLQCARAWNAVGVNSTDLYGYDIDVDCTILTFVHGLGIDLHYTAFNDIQSDCNIAPNGALVDFEAGHVIFLKPGFESGDGFHAFINPCAAPRPAPPVESVVISGAKPELTVPGETPAFEAWPNPSDGVVNFSFKTDRPSAVRLTVYDSNGQPVYQWQAPDESPAGELKHTWDAQAMPPGLYYAELVTADNRMVQKITRIQR